MTNMKSMPTDSWRLAAAFGCGVATPEDDMPFARPVVRTAAEAARLSVPGLDAPPLLAPLNWCFLLLLPVSVLSALILFYLFKPAVARIFILGLGPVSLSTNEADALERVLDRGAIGRSP